MPSYGHLRKTASGHLMRVTGGHLRKCPSPENTCNTCDPPIPDTLYVTFAGLAGDFAAYNGKHAIPWGHGCFWEVRNSVNENDWMTIHYSSGEWESHLDPDETASGCFVSFETAALSACAPAGSYPLDACGDGGCDDTDSCEDSAGATCVVSLT